MPAHVQHDDRERQRKPDPEPPRHVGKLGIGAGVGASASRARAPCRRSGRSPGRPAGSPDASGRCRSCPAGIGLRRASRFGRVEIFRGIGGEFRAAAGRAEVVGLARCAWRCGVVCGSTVMPQTGSSAASAAACHARCRDGGRARRADAAFVIDLCRRLACNIYPGGYIDAMQTNTKASVLKRLQRIEGQVRGLSRMVEAAIAHVAVDVGAKAPARRSGRSLPQTATEQHDRDRKADRRSPLEKSGSARISFFQFCEVAISGTARRPAGRATTMAPAASASATLRNIDEATSARDQDGRNRDSDDEFLALKGREIEIEHVHLHDARSRIRLRGGLLVGGQSALAARRAQGRLPRAKTRYGSVSAAGLQHLGILPAAGPA